jgi:hypothetical protein
VSAKGPRPAGTDLNLSTGRHPAVICGAHGDAVHADDPYTVLAPRPCLVETQEGIQRGLVIGRCGTFQLVVHGEGGLERVSWTPSEEVRVMDPSDWVPWSAALAANA